MRVLVGILVLMFALVSRAEDSVLSDQDALAAWAKSEASMNSFDCWEGRESGLQFQCTVSKDESGLSDETTRGNVFLSFAGKGTCVGSHCSIVTHTCMANEDFHEYYSALNANDQVVFDAGLVTNMFSKLVDFCNEEEGTITVRRRTFNSANEVEASYDFADEDGPKIEIQ